MNEQSLEKPAPLVILHVFHDSLSFDKVSDFFDSLPNVKNLYFYYTKNNSYEFTNVRRNRNKIRIFNDYKEYVKYFSDPSVDIIYFHSMPPSKYRLFNYISKDKKVVWWVWGYDIYSPAFPFLPPLVDIELYKPLTKREVNKNKKNMKSLWRYLYNVCKSPRRIKSLWRYLCNTCKAPYRRYMQNKMLKRVDFFSPVLPIECSLIQKIPHFRAKPFMVGGLVKVESIDFYCFHRPHNIMIGHSLVYTDNHFDIFSKIRNFSLDGQKLIIPIAYGLDYNCDRKDFKARSGLLNKDTIWIDHVLPYEEYASLINSVSHAIFGCIRQLAMGNISMCLRRSVKIFLYKDSLVYKQLKEWGYIVYTIDDDLSEEALRTVLPEELAFHNYSLNCKINEEKLRGIEQLWLIGKK